MLLHLVHPLVEEVSSPNAFTVDSVLVLRVGAMGMEERGQALR